MCFLFLVAIYDCGLVEKPLLLWFVVLHNNQSPVSPNSPIVSSLFFFPPLLNRGTTVYVTELGIFSCYSCFRTIWPVISDKCKRWGLYDSYAEASRRGLWLSAEKLAKFVSSQVCAEMPCFKRQKAGEAFALNFCVP